jgi:hypothetical protein
VIGQGAKSAGTSGPVNAPESVQMLVFPVMPPEGPGDIYLPPAMARSPNWAVQNAFKGTYEPMSSGDYRWPCPAPLSPSRAEANG